MYEEKTGRDPVHGSNLVDRGPGQLRQEGVVVCAGIEHEFAVRLAADVGPADERLAVADQPVDAMDSGERGRTGSAVWRRNHWRCRRAAQQCRRRLQIDHSQPVSKNWSRAFVSGVGDERVGVDEQPAKFGRGMHPQDAGKGPRVRRLVKRNINKRCGPARWTPRR